MAAPSNPPLPTPPFHLVPNINNLRSATHSLSTPHGPLRTDLLFRSADVSNLDLPGWQALHALGIAHVFDLRSKPEVDRSWAGADEPAWITAMQAAGVERSWVPVFAAADYSPAGLAERYMQYMSREVEGFVAAYRGILTNGGPAYQTILRYLIALDGRGGDSSAPRGALVHCTAGKDRTGVFFGVLFDFLGVSREEIAAEYQLTEDGLAGVREEIVERLLQTPGFQKYMLSMVQGKPVSVEEAAKLVEDSGAGAGELEIPPEVLEEGRQAALRMVGARKESMLRTLEMLDREFGGSEEYLRTVCGMGDEELEKLKKVLVVKS